MTDSLLHCHPPTGRRDPEPCDHGHSHAHDHDHSHGHVPEGTSARRLGIALGITVFIFAAQLVGGILTNSLALLADSGHLLTDAAALALALGAAILARRPASLKRTFGFRRVEVLAALFNGATVFLVAGFILVEAYHRVTEPEPVQSLPMLAVAVFGLLGNAAALWVLGHGHSLNERGAYLHVLGDLLSSVGVVVAGLLIFAFNLTIADPILSVVIALLLLNSAWRLMREAVDVLLLTVPASLDLAKVHDALMTVPGVRSAHDLHAWTVTSGFVSVSGHLTVLPAADQHAILVQALDLLRREFGLEHVTLQIEWDETQAAIHPECEPCRDGAPVPLAPVSARTH